jgi:hypothetical protein
MTASAHAGRGSAATASQTGGANIQNSIQA